MHQTIDVDGRPRSFVVVTPQHPSGDLVLVLHGSKQDAQIHRTFTGNTFDALAARGVVVAYLDGFQGNWNDARRAISFPARVQGVDDVAFVRAVIERLEATQSVDVNRVFGVGYSNGGQMVLRLVHEAPTMIAGAAVVAATMPAPDNFLLSGSSHPVTAMPVLLVHGTKDRLVPYSGGTMAWWARALFKVGGTVLSARDTARYFAERNGITGPPTMTRVASVSGSRTWVEHSSYRRMPVHPSSSTPSTAAVTRSRARARRPLCSVVPRTTCRWPSSWQVCSGSRGTTRPPPGPTVRQAQLSVTARWNTPRLGPHGAGWVDEHR